MKKMSCYSVLLLVVLLISSCGKADSITPSYTNVPNTPAYFGNWTVHKVVGSTPVSASIDEKMIGMKAVYTNEKASFDKNEIANPEYKELEMTKDDFLKEYRNQLSDIGIESNTIKMVEVISWTNPGGVLFIKDDQTLIFLWDGNYYEMKKGV
jgi:major membrane immunogen (membrane-anchored lipoprotein)